MGSSIGYPQLHPEYIRSLVLFRTSIRDQNTDRTPKSDNFGVSNRAGKEHEKIEVSPLSTYLWYEYSHITWNKHDVVSPSVKYGYLGYIHYFSRGTRSRCCSCCGGIPKKACYNSTAQYNSSSKYRPSRKNPEFGSGRLSLSWASGKHTLFLVALSYFDPREDVFPTIQY